MKLELEELLEILRVLGTFPHATEIFSGVVELALKQLKELLENEYEAE